jgi:hypothetical protein
MPLRGDMAPEPGSPDDGLAAWLAVEGRSLGHAVPASDLRAGFGTWLALTHDGYVATAAGARGGLGLRDAHGAALVAGDGDDGRHPVLVFGDGDAVARRLVEAHRAWQRERPSLDRLHVAAHPSGAEPAPPKGAHVVRRPNFTFVVTSA